MTKKVKISLLNPQIHMKDFFSKYFDINSIDKNIPILIFSDKDILKIPLKKRLLFPNEKKVELFNNKLSTNSWLKRNGFNIIKTTIVSTGKIAKEKCITKPKISTGRIGFRIWNKGETINCQKGHIVQPFIKGKEFNLDILKNKKGKVYVCAKEKLLIKAGATFKCKLTNNQQVQKIGITLGEKIDYIGSIDVDVIASKNKYYIIDINPRIGGGFFHSINLDKNFLNFFLSIFYNKKFIEYDLDYEKKSIIKYEYKIIE